VQRDLVAKLRPVLARGHALPVAVDVVQARWFIARGRGYPFGKRESAMIIATSGRSTGELTPAALPRFPGIWSCLETKGYAMPPQQIPPRGGWIR
jgi:hypothetical protein